MFISATVVIIEKAEEAISRSSFRGFWMGKGN
jgi:hypothetical protein